MEDKNIGWKNKKYVKLIPVAVTLVIYCFVGFFIISSLKTQPVEETVKEKEKGFETKPAEVSLTIYYDTAKVVYAKKLWTKDSVSDLLELLYKEEHLYFEKNSYSYGIELDNVNGIKAFEGHKWRVFKDNLDITFNIGEEKLEDGKNYTLKLVPVKNNT